MDMFTTPPRRDRPGVGDGIPRRVGDVGGYRGR